MKEYLKALELRKQAEEAIMKVAKRGEPLDPEMLNPARKRDPYQVSLLKFINLINVISLVMKRRTKNYC